MNIDPDFGCAIIDAVWSELGSALEPDYWLALEKGRRRLQPKPAPWSLIEDKLRFLAHECVFVYGRMITELALKIDDRLPVADPSCWSRRQMKQLCHDIAGHYDARRLRVAKEGLIAAACAGGIDPAMTPLDDALDCIRRVLKATVLMVDCLPADLRGDAAPRLAEAAFDSLHTLLQIEPTELRPATVYWDGKRCVVRQRSSALHLYATADPEAARHAAVFTEHPCVLPDRITFNAVYDLFEPPSELASTSEWLKFRDEILRPLTAVHPHDPNLPNFLRQTNVILAWRATIAPEDRFWRTDEPTPH
jgi:hypothetical protein